MSGRNLLSFLRYQSRFWSDENAFAQDGGTDRGLGSLAALAHYFADFTITPVSEPVAEGDKPAADKAPEATAEAIVFELATDEPAIVFDQEQAQPAPQNHTITYAAGFTPVVPAHAADPAPTAGHSDSATDFAAATPD